ncbi:MFS transporter [Pseudomonas sp. zfem002]|uniref:MFS transporter n=1 Tax=Pseudomonas sp. zfem002 TaxID=3078197 RepID=UPI0029295034|nr:MFS transporter [Pseudomonas sp. zfem002]MDU9393402.1 MFS transporter [Pseudomonas sp. zfem002]
MRALAINHDTRRLSTAYLFSKIGEFAFEAAFAVSVVQLTNANLLLIGVIYFLRYIPTLIFSPLGGWLADNYSKRKILISAELIKAIAAIILFFTSEAFDSPIIVIIFASMIMTTGDCLYSPTFRSYFPHVVEKNQLSSLNSGLQAIEDCSSIIGPLIFSLITIAFFPALTFLFFLACLIASAAWLLALREFPTSNTTALQPYSIIKEAMQSIGRIRQSNPSLFTVICCTTLCAIFATSILRFILPAAVLEEFHIEAAVGYVNSLLATGTVLGSILYEKFNLRTSSRSVVRYWWIYGCLLFISALALNLSTSAFIASLFFVGFVGAFVDISIITNIQLLSLQSETGRNFSLYYFTAVLGDALSGLVASIVFLIAGPATLIGMTFLLSVAPLAWGVKSDEDEKHDCI